MRGFLFLASQLNLNALNCYTFSKTKRYKFVNMKIEDIYKIYRQHSSIQTDTRKLKQNDLFF